MKNPSEFPKNNPFGVPEGYFEMLEERIVARIEEEERGLTPKMKVIRLVKPLLGLAASFVLVYLLVSYPLRTLMPVQMATQSTEEANATGEYIPDVEKDILADPFFVEETAFFEALTNEETTVDFDDDEIMSIVASEMDDYAVYAELTY